MKYHRFHIGGTGGPTRAEYEMKLEIDVTGKLVVTKIANAVTVINAFVAKYAGDLEWDYIFIGGERKTSRWWPSTCEGDDCSGWSRGFTEGICGMICLGFASDCVGVINGMSYQQGREGEVVCFTNVGRKSLTSGGHDYQLASVGGLILLGRTCIDLPCTENGSHILEAVGFRTSRETVVEATKTLQPASPASQSHVHDEDEIYDRVMIEGGVQTLALCFHKGHLGPKDAR